MKIHLLRPNTDRPWCNARRSLYAVMKLERVIAKVTCQKCREGYLLKLGEGRAS